MIETETKERPIPFSTPMVQAILNGTKTQTRRIIKGTGLDWLLQGFAPEFVASSENDLCPYGKIGDVLWVRETHYSYGRWVINGIAKTGRTKYKFIKSDEEVCFSDTIISFGETFYLDIKPNSFRMEGWYKRLARFMFKSSCRIFLEITDISVQHLQDISEEDAIAEGILPEERHGEKGWKDYSIIHSGKHKGKDHPHGMVPFRSPIDSYKSLWEKINGPKSWNENPWVWVLKFKQIKK